jgi:DNA polymerase-3 subunit delta
MSPAQFLAKMKRKEIAPVYLFLGAEAYQRRKCREALIAAHLDDAARENGLAQHDLSETSLAELMDDARALSLFASQRVIIVTSAEAVLPRTAKAEEDADEDGPSNAADAGVVASYIKDPTPGVIVLFESARFDFEGEDKKKLERVAKFYSAIRDVVELKRYSLDDARVEAQAIARRANVALEPSAIELLLEALGGDVARIAIEIEKLALFSAGGKPITAEDLALLVPDARATTIFALVGALGRRDRNRSMHVLDTLCREGEYLPLALSFLSTQFRTALIAKESGLRSSQQIQAHFTKLGIPMWGARAEQVYQTLSKFSKEQLQRGLQVIFEADRDLRSARPDDRIIMEDFVLKLTA